MLHRRLVFVEQSKNVYSPSSREYVFHLDENKIVVKHIFKLKYLIVDA